MSMFTKAKKSAAKLRMSIDGISGAGKTYTALAVGSALAEAAGGRLCVVDTENNSASKYADIFDFDGLNMAGPFDPRKLIEVMKAAERENYGALVIDSLSHFWAGPGGVLEIVDNAAARSNSKNSFAAWREGTPVQNKLIEAIVQCRIHLICCMRSKTEYVTEKDERTGKVAPRKVGLAPVQRDQFEYEFDIVGSMNEQHQMVITKSRCPALDRAVIDLPGKHLAKTLLGWLSDGVPAVASAAAPAPAAKAEAPKAESARQKLAKVLQIWGSTNDREQLKGLARKACILAKLSPDQTLDEAGATKCILAVQAAMAEDVKPGEIDDIPGTAELPPAATPAPKPKSPSVKKMADATKDEPASPGPAPRKPSTLPAYAPPKSVEEAWESIKQWRFREEQNQNADQYSAAESRYIAWCLASLSAYIEAQPEGNETFDVAEVAASAAPASGAKTTLGEPEDVTEEDIPF